MAIIQCKECGESISDAAESCPHCGVPLKAKKPDTSDKKSSSNIGCGGMLLILVGVFVLVGIFNDDSDTGSSTNWRNEDNSSMAYIMMEDFVKQRLKSPSSAEFPSAFDGRSDHVQKIGGRTYRIDSYVDAENSFGASLRMEFTGKIEQISEDEWRLQSLEIKD